MYLKTQIENLLRLAQEQESYEPYYEVLSSITFTGNEYFDTGILGDVNTKIEAGIFLTSMPSVESEGNYYIFGSRSGSATANNIDCIWSWQSGLVCDFNNSAYATYRLSVAKTNLALNTVYDVTVNKNKRDVSRNGTSLGSNTTANSDTFTSTNTICIGLVKGANISSYTGFNGGLKYFKINDDDYVPVLDSQMRPCLYNRTTKTFLYAKKISDGTTTYDLGFKRWNKYDVDYIESSGTQYINSNYKTGNNIGFEIDAMCLNDSSQYHAMGRFYGATASEYAQSNMAIFGSSSGGIVGCQGGDTASGKSAGRITADIDWQNKRHICKINKGSFYVDDALIGSVTPSITSPGDIYIGALNGTSAIHSGRIYGAKIWDNDILVRDYKPSVRTYNDGTSVVTKAFMYDEVYNKAYYNAGTGSFKAYIEADREVYNLSMHDTIDTDGFYLAEDGTKTVSSDGTSCYTEAIQVKQGDIIEWTVTAEAVTANKRIHGYSTYADITTGQKGSWVEMLAKIVFSTTSDTTQTASFVVPSGVNYIRLSHANTRETKDSIVRIRTYEVGKAIKYPQNNGFTLDAPDSSNFILDLLTRATTTNSYYMLDTRNQTGSSNEEEFGIGGSSTGSTVNWKCAGNTILIKTNGTNWARSSNYTYSQLLVGYKDGNTFKRTASFYDFNNQRTSDVTVETATRDVADNTKPLTVLHTTSGNWLQNGADIHYFKYLQDDNDVWYDCIPVRNATLTSSVILFDRANNTSLPNTGSGTPTFVALD